MSAYAPQHQKTSSSNNNYGYGEDLFVRRYRPFSPFVSKRQLHQIDSEPFEAADEWPLFGGYGSSSRGLRNPYSWMSKK
jgi:hypothetical protein